MFAIKIDDPKTEYLKVEVNLQDLDKEHLKDGTLLQTGRGRMGVFHDDALLDIVEISGIVDVFEGGIELYGKPMDVTPHPTTEWEVFELV